MRTAPSVLVNDAKMKPVVEVLAETMAILFDKCSYPTIFSRIDELPESLLDILAKDFKIEWYDPNYDLAAKRNILRDSFYVHRHMGTRAAVETALTDIWPNSVLEEWFEYEGEPFHFRIVVTYEWSPEEEEAIKTAIERVKNERSVLDAIMFNSGGATIDLNVATAVCGIEIVDDVKMI